MVTVFSFIVLWTQCVISSWFDDNSVNLINGWIVTMISYVRFDGHRV